MTKPHRLLMQESSFRSLLDLNGCHGCTSSQNTDHFLRYSGSSQVPAHSSQVVSSQVRSEPADLLTPTLSPPSHLERMYFQSPVSFSLPPCPDTQPTSLPPPGAVKMQLLLSALHYPGRGPEQGRVRTAGFDSVMQGKLVKQVLHPRLLAFNGNLSAGSASGLV